MCSIRLPSGSTPVGERRRSMSRTEWARSSLVVGGSGASPPPPTAALDTRRRFDGRSGVDGGVPPRRERPSHGRSHAARNRTAVDGIEQLNGAHAE
ncbi:hypothetical protein MTO96_003178 [Rhipicephalus appendiculatus]